MASPKMFDFLRPHSLFAQVTQGLNNKRKLLSGATESFRAGVFEKDRAAAHENLVLWAVREVRNFRGNLGRKSQDVCSPCSFGDDFPSLPARDKGWRSPP